MVAKIEFERVHKSFAVKPRGQSGPAQTSFAALEDVSLSVRAGELLAIVGPSGCGKSTLLDLLAGLTPPTSGRILLDGKVITGPALDRGVVFQQYALFPWRTALQNIEFGLEAKKLSARDRRDIARAHLALVGLSGFEDRHPHELSGGMKQRVAIARSLAYDPEVLMMDEPFAALDAQTRESLQDELLRIWEASKKTVIFITHGIDEAVYLGQRVAVMSGLPGRIKHVVDLPSRSGQGSTDFRGTALFGELRQHIGQLLRQERCLVESRDARRASGVRAIDVLQSEVAAHG